MAATPKHDDVVRQLRAEILAGEYDRPDRPFPSSVALAERFGVSRPTVSRALHRLAESGLIRLREKAAPLVLHPDMRPATPWPAGGRYARARAARGLIFATDVEGRIRKDTMSAEWVTPSAEVAKLLQVGPRTKVLRRVSRTYLDGRPVEQTAMHFPRAIIRAVPAFEDPAASILVLSMIEDTGRQVERTANRIRARLATDDETEGLDLEPGAIVLEWTHGTYTDTGEPVEAVVNVKPATGTDVTFETYEAPLDH